MIVFSIVCQMFHASASGGASVLNRFGLDVAVAFDVPRVRSYVRDSYTRVSRYHGGRVAPALSDRERLSPSC